MWTDRCMSSACRASKLRIVIPERRGDCKHFQIWNTGGATALLLVCAVDRHAAWMRQTRLAVQADDQDGQCAYTLAGQGAPPHRRRDRSMRAGSILGHVFLAAGVVLADVKLTSPAAGASVVAGTISLQWQDSGALPALSSIATADIVLCTGTNSNIVSLAHEQTEPCADNCDSKLFTL